MPIKLRTAAYPGAIAPPPCQIVIRARGQNGAPAGGNLDFVDAAGQLITVQPVAPNVAEWRMAARAGPTMDIPTAAGVQAEGPTVPPSEFRFILDVRAINPVTQQEERVLVVVERDGQPSPAEHPTNGAPPSDIVVEVGAEHALDLHLRS